MKTTLIHLNEQATETLEAMLDPGYIYERTERLQAIEDFLIDQWRDAGYKFCNRPGAHGLEFKWMFRER